MITTIATTGMNLGTARRYATALVDWLRPYVHRIEIAGSVRRERPICNDIDLVCVPKLELPFNDLLGEPQGEPKSLMREFVIHYVRTNAGKAWFRNGATGTERTHEPQPNGVNFLLHLPKCELDIFAANDENFITRLITRTGSKEHNIWIATRAIEMGGHFAPQEGLSIKGKKIVPLSEEEFYAALQLPFIHPRDREAEYLRRFL
jgi:DNA polymerase/3'-5' exonuclease PolX